MLSQLFRSQIYKGKGTDTHDFKESKAHVLVNNYAVPGEHVVKMMDVLLN
jgi:hypothetical protein